MKSKIQKKMQKDSIKTIFKDAKNFKRKLAIAFRIN